MITCPVCNGTGQYVDTNGSGMRLYCSRCNGTGQIGGDAPRPWIETRGLFGGTTIYESQPFVSVTYTPLDWAQRVELLERRVARLETQARRKPRRKAGRR